MFPSCLKMTNVTHVYKIWNRSDKDNYRPVSILPNLSKNFERCLYEQISTFFEDILSKYQCGLRKEHTAQERYSGGFCDSLGRQKSYKDKP